MIFIYFKNKYLQIKVDKSFDLIFEDAIKKLKNNEFDINYIKEQLTCFVYKLNIVDYQNGNYSESDLSK